MVLFNLFKYVKIRDKLNPNDLSKILTEMPSEARRDVWANDPNHVFIIDGVEYRKPEKKQDTVADEQQTQSANTKKRSGKKTPLNNAKKRRSSKKLTFNNESTPNNAQSQNSSVVFTQNPTTSQAVLNNIDNIPVVIVQDSKKK